MKLIIGNKNYSSWSLRPWLLLKHFNVAFEEQRIALFTETYESEVAEYNSDSKVPILLDNDITVWDSLAILEYISEQHLEGKGWPSDKKARAFARSISHEMHSSYFNVRNEFPMNCRKQFTHISPSQDAEFEIDRIHSLWQQCRNNYGQNGDWLFGEFSIADAMFAPIALRFKGYNIPINGVEGDYMLKLLNYPHLLDWVKAGTQETEVISFDEA